MSSTAHWLVLGAVASRERVLSTWETERLTRTHSICTLIERKHLHSQKKKEKNTCACSFRHIHSGILSPPSSGALELCCCPSAGHYLPSPPVPCFVLPFPLPMSSFSCGSRLRSLDVQLWLYEPGSERHGASAPLAYIRLRPPWVGRLLPAPARTQKCGFALRLPPSPMIS